MAKKNEIKVFKAERDDGVAKLVQANASIGYVTQLQDTKLSQEVAKEFLKSVSSAGEDSVDESQFDLFYLNTILVTTGCNKNLDVFAKSPTWSARYSPVHKQFNLEHDQSKIIGHMTSSKAVDVDFNPIPDDASIDDIPDKFHILTGAVIYRVLSDEKAQEDIERIIEEIADNQWYVSMECLFKGFDYAAIASNGEQRVISRTEETAWLTKHLVQYGGSGQYNGFTLGRVLNNITFSGKGLVRKPANPESIIFNETVKAFHTTYANLGYITSSTDSTKNSDDDVNSSDKNEKSILGDNSMANEVNPETDKAVKALEKALEESRAENKTLADQVKTHESSATTAKITKLESDLKSKADCVALLETELKTANEAKADLDAKLKASEARAAAAEKEVADSKAAELVRSRVAKLTKLNAPEDEAAKIVALFSDKNDADFETLVALFSSKWVAVATQLETKPAPAAASATVPANALDGVEPEVDASLATVDPGVEKTRAAMSAVFASMLHGDTIETDGLND